jgi:tripartite-type tricarboxylate transporter receptor subunit TctC
MVPLAKATRSPATRSLRALSFAALALAASLALDAAAQDYPSRAITLINPASAGGSNEALKTIIFDRLATALGVPIVMESKSGAGGAIAAAYTAKAAPDGYTLLLAGGSILTTLPAIKKDLPYDPLRDFTPIVMLIGTSPLLVVNKTLPATTTKEFVELARSRPGKLNYGSYGLGSATFLAFELFKQAAGIDVVHIPYRGSAPLLVALLSGEVDAAFEMPPTIKPHLAAGTLRALGIASSTRSRLFPDVPTLAEQGYPLAAGGYIVLCRPAQCRGQQGARAARGAAANPRHRLRACGRNGRRGGELDTLGPREVATPRSRHRLPARLTSRTRIAAWR